MTLGAKILAAAAVLCLIVWGAFLAVGAQPLMATKAFQVIYGEHEDFFADAAVYRKSGNSARFILHAPRARAAYRWWTVDFRDMTITASGAPRSLGGRKYLLRGDGDGVRIDDRQTMGDWFWHFTEAGASFTGNGFTCSIRKVTQAGDVRTGGAS